jgi:ferredoxin
MENGIAVIDQKLCVGCGTCVGTCPRHVIELMPESAQILVRCHNSAPAREARAACSKACIACKRCEKECPADAIHVENDFARIDQSKCTRCGACVKVCPDKCITDGDVHKNAQQAEAS